MDFEWMRLREGEAQGIRAEVRRDEDPRRDSG